MAQKSGWNTFLKVLGILDIIGGVIAFIGAILLFAAGAAGVSGTVDIADTTTDATTAVTALGIVTVVAAILSLVAGIASVRLAKDPTRKVSFVITLVFAALALAGNGTSFANIMNGSINGSNVLQTIVTFVLNGLIIYAALKLHKEATGGAQANA